MGRHSFDDVCSASLSRLFRRAQRVQQMAVCLAIVLATASCGVIVVSNEAVLDEPFRAEQAHAIRNGQTTKQEILHWLGPPLVVARPGTTVRMPKPELYNALSSDVPAETLFDRFLAVVPPPRSPVLYYYEDQKLQWTDVGSACFVGRTYGGTKPASGTMNVVRLWVLLDDSTQLVVDHRVETESQTLTKSQVSGLDGMWK
jgi:hypothetical protein